MAGIKQKMVFTLTHIFREKKSLNTVFKNDKLKIYNLEKDSFFKVFLTVNFKFR
jgi:hypothetical protein